MSTNSKDMPCLNASINFSKGSHCLKLRALSGGIMPITGYDEGAFDTGLLYGYRHSFGNISISYLAGAAITHGSFKGDKLEGEYQYPGYEMIDYKTFGFPIEVQIDMNALRPLGLSVSLFGDLNTEKSFIGFCANILIGRLP